MKKIDNSSAICRTSFNITSYFFTIDNCGLALFCKENAAQLLLKSASQILLKYLHLHTCACRCFQVGNLLRLAIQDIVF